ncbi:MAG: glycosyltransferase family 4 protein, partial [Muribaculaceae bacterium]|nr:glycosyltransferase family 4 protein [Muribaculaceae bacterium]
VSRRINAFVVPSTFTISKLQQYGIPAEKLIHIPTFFNSNAKRPEPSYRPFFLYVGRIEKQKGLATLIKAFENTDMHLRIIGFSNDGYEEKLKASLNGKRHNIEFMGRMTFDEIIPYLNSCLATVVPSEWYDNFPNAILESFAYSKPVIATDFGSMKELVANNITGYTFPYADADALRSHARHLLDNPAEARRMGAEARRLIDTEYSPDSHYKALMQVLNTITNQRSRQK